MTTGEADDLCVFHSPGTNPLKHGYALDRSASPTGCGVFMAG